MPKAKTNKATTPAKTKKGKPKSARKRAGTTKSSKTNDVQVPALASQAPKTEPTPAAAPTNSKVAESIIRIDKQLRQHRGDYMDGDQYFEYGYDRHIANMIEGYMPGYFRQWVGDDVVAGVLLGLLEMIVVTDEDLARLEEAATNYIEGFIYGGDGGDDYEDDDFEDDLE